MLSPFVSLVIFLGTALFFAVPLLVVIYAIVFVRLKRQQTLSPTLVQRSLLMLSLWLTALATLLVAMAVHPPHGYAAAWLADVLVGCATIAGAMILWLRPKPIILTRLGWSLTVGGVLLTAFMAFSIHIAAVAYEIGRYSDFNEVSVQSDMARNPNDLAHTLTWRI
jgi:O-antigen ligase